jgi:poly(glycerol-phosphate) alpha-glucosyltransferase
VSADLTAGGPSGDVSRLTLHLPLNTLALRRGGLVTAVLRRAGLLAASGRFAGVWIEVLGLQVRLDQDVESLRTSGHLHPDVHVRSLLRALDPSGTGHTVSVPVGTMTPALGLPVLEPPIARSPALLAAGKEAVASSQSVDPTAAARADDTLRRLLPDLDGLASVPDRLDPAVRLLLRDGLPVARLRSAPGAASTSERRPWDVELLDPVGRAVQVAELDDGGRLVHVVDLATPGDSEGRARLHRFFGHDGRCYLTVSEQQDGSWHSPVLRTDDGPPRSLAGSGELYRLAFERVLAAEEHPVLFSEFRENLPNLPDRTLDDVVRAVRHPRLRTVAVGHSNHRRTPFTAGSGATPNWHRLLRDLDCWDRLVLLTQAQRSDVATDLSAFDVPADRVTVIPHVVPDGALHRVEGYDADRIAMVARLHSKKRVKEAVRALRLVVDARPSARLDVYGFGYDDAYEHELHALVRSLGLDDHVRLHGFVPVEPGRTPYDGACVTWLTSASEGFGLSLLESMARGVPVVSFDTPYGPAELVGDGQGGVVVPFGDIEALARHTLAVMDDEGLRDRLSAGATATAARFDEAGYVDAWCDTLRSLQGPLADRATLAPAFELESAGWHGDLLRLGVGVAGDAVRAQLLVTVRGTDETRVVPMRHGWAEVELPPMEAGTIVDFSVRAEVVDWDVHDASVTHVSERRVVTPDLDLPSHPRWRLYRTAHGSFSAKAARPASGATRPHAEPVSVPQRVARALARRL